MILFADNAIFFCGSWQRESLTTILMSTLSLTQEEN